MSEYRFILEIGTKKHLCPSCEKKRFVFYVDTLTNNYLPPKYGRCDRESSCAYHLNPYADGYAKMITDNERGQNVDWKPAEYKPIKPVVKPISYIDFETFKSTLGKNNNFIDYLHTLFDAEVVEELKRVYFIGTHDTWNNSTVFWQIDVKGKIRTGKIMLYDSQSGKRVKKPYNHFTWMHKKVDEPDFNLSQCFFGEHQLNHTTKPIAIVESEKTAIIASVYFPEFTWLACGGLSNLSASKFEVLKGRTVTLFPDLNGFDKWTEKIKSLPSGIKFTKVSDLLERIATTEEKANGLDLADYLIRFNYKEFLKSEQVKQPEVFEAEISEPLPAYILDNFEVVEYNEPADTKEWFSFSQQPNPSKVCWLNQLAELETFFTTVAIPNNFKLNQSSTISDPKKFIKSHSAMIRHNNGKKAFEPYLNRLAKLKSKIEQNRHENKDRRTN